MNNSQSIDDILRQLKSSVSSEDNLGSEPVTDTVADEYSEEALKRELKNQYFESDEDSSYVSEDQYSIDGDFLDEAELIRAQEQDAQSDEIYEEEPITEETSDVEIEAPADEEPEEIQEIDEIEEIEEIDDSEEIEEIEEIEEVEDSFTEDVEDINDMFEDDLDDDIDDIGIFEDFGETEELEAIDGVEDTEATDEPYDAQENVAEIDEEEIPLGLISDQDGDQEFDEGFETEDYEQDIVYTELQLEAPMTVEDIEDSEPLYLAAADEVDADQHHGDNAEVEETPADQPRETYISLMRNIGVDLSGDQPESRSYSSADDAYAASTADDLGEDINVSEGAEQDELDLSTINLMMQLGEQDELNERIGGKNVKNIQNILKEEPAVAEPITASPIAHGEEYVDKDQDEIIRGAYKKKYLSALFAMCGCIVLAIMSLLFEALPILEVGLDGIFDYVTYPGFFVLIGLQFVIFSAAICARPLWSGVRSIISAAPNRHSYVAVMICANVIYDIWISIAVAVGDDLLPPLFNAMTAVVIAISASIDFAKVSANMHTFNVYSSDSSKYTIVDEKERGKISQKMYSGGVAMTKSIRTVAPVDFPRGLFKGIGEKDGQSRSMTVIMIVSILISIIATVVSAILGLDVYASLGAFMICMFASAPITMMCADNVPLASAAIKLAKRGIAIAGKGAVSKHSKCDYMVFGDLHMFKKCRTEDVGIAMYDKGVSYLTLGCLDALYSKIGGPLSGMGMNLPDVFKFQSVDIRRITRNGVEAVIDRKHVLVVGEHSFLLRYGIVFPEDEKQTDRCSLCVSLNGGVTAKLSVKYEPEPIFEMLVERLHNQGVACVIETYDPLINSDMIARSRTLGDAPVSVVHKNAEDYREKPAEAHRGQLDGVIACSSRLKLAEAEVWLKKLNRVERITKIFSACSCAVGIICAMLLVIFGIIGSFNQYHVLIYLLLQGAIFAEMLVKILPNKKYFTVEALYDELERESIKQQKKLDSAAGKRQGRKKSEQAESEEIQEESNTDE